MLLASIKLAVFCFNTQRQTLPKIQGHEPQSSADNRFHPRCNDCFRAFELLWGLAQVLASKIDQML